MYTVINNIRFDVFAIKVEPPGQTRCLTDQRKIGYELQKMIDALVDACIPSPIVCGVSVDVKTCSTYKMDLKYNGLYRLIELDTFQLPTTMEDIMKARRIFSMLMKLKSICEKVELTIKERKLYNSRRAPLK
jgi:hypothetical protein